MYMTYFKHNPINKVAISKQLFKALLIELSKNQVPEKANQLNFKLDANRNKKIFIR